MKLRRRWRKRTVYAVRAASRVDLRPLDPRKSRSNLFNQRKQQKSAGSRRVPHVGEVGWVRRAPGLHSATASQKRRCRWSPEERRLLAAPTSNDARGGYATATAADDKRGGAGPVRAGEIRSRGEHVGERRCVVRSGPARAAEPGVEGDVAHAEGTVRNGEAGTGGRSRPCASLRTSPIHLSCWYSWLTSATSSVLATTRSWAGAPAGAVVDGAHRKCTRSATASR